jgi:hypothetical protein
MIKLTQLPTGLQPLADYNQWIIWERLPMRMLADREYRRRDLVKMGMPDTEIDKLPLARRTEKVPVHPVDLKCHNAHDSGIQMPCNDALKRASELPEQFGVGFSFSESDPFFFVDVDACADPSQPNGWSPRANELMTKLAGACVEVSQSGSGLHIIGQTDQLPPRSCKYRDEFDLYTEGRFVALTGDRVVGSAATNHTPALALIASTYLPPTPNIITEATDGPDPDWSGHTDDVELLAHAMVSTSAMSMVSGRASFADLWNANVEALGRSYPDDNGREYDQSEADAALAQHLAFWTGRDAGRMERLMRQSALAREKWDERPDYMARTIGRACGLQRDVHQKSQKKSVMEPEPSPAPEDIPENTSMAVGAQLMPVSAQLKYFKGCAYVMDMDRILTPTGDLMKQTQFKAMYGGYQFILDNENMKVTKNAWEAFTESQAIRHPKVHCLQFRPTETPGIIKQTLRGRTAINSFYPEYGERIPGDVTPFLTHVSKLLPNAADQDILLSYLAACVQYPGHKFQWCIVLQGLPGNGKTALTYPLVHALGESYCFQLNPRDASNVFTAWVERKLLVVLEEIRVAGKMELADALKPIITNSRIPIQGKGKDQTTGDNFANFVMFSNHRDAVLKTQDDRRYCVFYTAQQELEDLARSGMTEQYFLDLYAWLRGPGCPAVAEYLATRLINVNVMGRAPETSSTRSAMYESLGPCEQIILEAIDMEKIGFRGDLVSSVQASNELAGSGRGISPRAVGNVLRSIGYTSHPALDNSAGKITINGQRFRVYARRGTKAAALHDADAVRAHWESFNK